MDGRRTEDGDQNGGAEQRLLRHLGSQLGVSTGPGLEDAEWHEDTNVDVEELVVVQVAPREVKHRDGEKLDH